MHIIKRFMLKYKGYLFHLWCEEFFFPGVLLASGATCKGYRIKSVREEFRLPFDLAEKSRKHAFESTTTKTSTVVETLKKYFK